MRYEKHGYATGGVSPIYSRWYSMIERCHNPKNSSYKYYGARGIKVCPRWRKSIKNFIEDMGEPPKDKTLDRINNNRGYSKNNCRWATREEQRMNQREYSNTLFLTYKGKKRTLKEWGRIQNINYVTLHARIYRYGYSPKQALGL
jgi:hypothetical protein